MSAAALPAPGQLVEVRRRRFSVKEVQASALPADPLGGNGSHRPQHLVSLVSVEDDGLGEELQVVWEIEPGARVYERATLPEVEGFDEPRRLDAFLDAVRWGVIASADVRALHAPFRSAITLEEYQLDPVVRALQMPRVNLLVADDVGLGKTIEAGLVVQELLLRHRARSVLVVVPASLQVQWKEQMRGKFGLEFRIVDSALLKDLRRRRGLHVNPWAHFPRLITSIDFLKRERPLRLFRETLPPEGEPAFPRKYDLLIVDEAHNVAPSGRKAYAVDSLRTQAIRTLAPHFEHKLFLTATPHNGYRESFAALLELLDNQRFHRGMLEPDKAQLAAVMIRRLKSELLRRPDGSQRFAERRILPIEVPYHKSDREAHAALKRYGELRLKKASETGERFAAEFCLKLLKKRLFSSPQAFRTTLEKHVVSLAKAARKRRTSIRGLQREVDQMDEDVADDEAYEELAGDVVMTASSYLSDLDAEERTLLKTLELYARTASGGADAKAETFLEWLRATVKPDGRWGDTRVIIFTEYRATQKWLQTLLAAEGLARGERLLTMFGGMDRDERERIKNAFQASPRQSKVRILLATDTASEGIDLQNHCSRLVHYEVPWNPNRMEQRNGRVDRHGQRAAEVQVYHFVGKGYAKGLGGVECKPGDLDGDLEFLMRAAQKVDKIREDLGKVGPVIAQQVEEAMLGRRAALDTRQAERDAAPVRKVLKLERKLREQLRRFTATLDASRSELRLAPAHVRAVCEVGLELAGQPPLREAVVSGLWPDPTGERATCPCWHVPPLRGSWARCAEGLEHPHTGKVRPVVFDAEVLKATDGAVTVSRDDVVLCHLNHRLVQMCLGLLRAELWGGSDRRSLRRVTARIVPTDLLDQTAVIGHSRLIYLGGDSVRLHEELITAGGLLEEAGLKRIGVRRTKALLDAATNEPIPEALQRRLLEAWTSRHAAALEGLLGKRRGDRMVGLETLLREREQKEVTDLTAVLLELKRSIEETLTGGDPKERFLFSTMEENDQLERNRGALAARARAIPAEIERETAAIRRRYQDPRFRLFPAAITFLVPEALARAGRIWP